jgi:hypothetical protein
MRFDSVLEEGDRFLRPASVGDSEFFAALLVVGNKKFLDLREERLADIGDGFEILVLVGVDCGAEKTAVFSVFPSSVCSASIMPMIRTSIRQPT